MKFRSLMLSTALFGLTLQFPLDLPANPCQQAAATLLRVTTENFQLKKLSEEYAQLGGPGKPLLTKVDSKRLINRRDWVREVEQGSRFPLEIYEPGTLNHWFEAAKLVQKKGGDLPVTLESLQLLHQTAMKEHYYMGYEMRRLMESHEFRKSPNKEALKLVLKKKVNAPLDALERAMHNHLHGAIRNNDKDPIFFTGLDEISKSNLTKVQLATLKEKPYIRLVSVKPKPNDQFKIAGFLGDAHNVAQEATEILERADQALAKVPREDLDQVIRLTVKMGQDLMALHPFHDGNGRTIRLLQDSIYMKFGLPPPLFPNELDLVMTLDEAVATAKAGMAEYLEASRLASH